MVLFKEKSTRYNNMQGNRLSTTTLVNYIEQNWRHYSDGSDEIVSESADKVTNSQIHPLKLNMTAEISSLGGMLDSVLTNIDPELQRTGVLTNVDQMEDTDISLYSSILWVLRVGFSNYKRHQQADCVIEFIKAFKLASQSDKFKEFGYKEMGWTQKHLLQDIKSGEITSTVVRFLADFLYINIFIINLGNSKLYYSGTDEWIPYKKNIILVRHHNKNFEPVYTKTCKTFEHNSKFASYISLKPYSVDKMYCDMSGNENKSFVPGEEDLNKYIVNEPVIEEESEAVNGFDEDHSDGSEESGDYGELENLSEQPGAEADDDEEEEEEEDETESLSKLSFEELRQRARDNDVKTYVLKKGKKIKKSHKKLLDEMIELLRDDDSEEITESEEESEEEVEEEVPDYQDFTVAKLRELAKRHGVSIKDSDTNKLMVKKKLLDTLDTHFSDR